MNGIPYLVERAGVFRHHALLLFGRQLGDSGLSSQAFRAVAAAYCGLELAADDSASFWEEAVRNPDVFIADRQRPTLRLEDIAGIRDLAFYPPVAGKKRLFLIDRCTRLNTNAANALLKVLEEPPGKALFLLTAGSLSEVLPTIASRCQRVGFVQEQTEGYRPERMFESDDWTWLSGLCLSMRSERLVPPVNLWDPLPVSLSPSRFHEILEKSTLLCKKYDVKALQDAVVALMSESWKREPRLAPLVRDVLADLREWRDALPYHPSASLWLARILFRVALSA